MGNTFTFGSPAATPITTPTGLSFGAPPVTPPVISAQTGTGIWNIWQLVHHLRLPPALAEQAHEQEYILDLQAAAVEFAETAMNRTLLTRTRVMHFYGEGMPWSFGYAWGETYYDDGRNKLVLRRGPVQSVASITDANGTIGPSNYSLERIGVTDYVRMNVGWVSPLTITYVAGDGTQPRDVPADIRQAIRMHVGTMYECRESVGVGKASDAIPHSLGDFYRLKSRNVTVG